MKDLYQKENKTSNFYKEYKKDNKKIGDGYFDIDKSDKNIVRPNYFSFPNNKSINEEFFDNSLGCGMIFIIILGFFLLIGANFYFYKDYQKKQVIKLQSESFAYINNSEYDKAIETYNQIIDINYSSVVTCNSYMAIIGVNQIRDNTNEVKKLCEKAKSFCENDLDGNKIQADYYNTCRK